LLPSAYAVAIKQKVLPRRDARGTRTEILS